MITTVGIADHNGAFEATLYPNPTTGIVSIDFDNLQQNTLIRLKSITGQILVEEHLINGNRIDLTINQPNGLYIIEIQDQGGNIGIFNIVKSQ
ncbi:MAG: hypothetical protein Salg2KO_01300 [Salibacteraceae bacterium]